MKTITTSGTDGLPESRIQRKRLRLSEDIAQLRTRMQTALEQPCPQERQVAERLRRMIALREELLAQIALRK
jgi:hypothetical protein